MFEKYVMNQFWGFIRRLAEPQPIVGITPRTVAQQDFLENFNLSYFDRPRDESRTFGTKFKIEFKPDQGDFS